ncbi:MAG: alpha-glucosidase [Clostridia bacterium]
MKIINDDKSLKLLFKDQVIFEHSEKDCFACALNWKVGYKSTHGNFKVKEKIKGKFKLTKAEILQKTDSSASIKFSGEGKSLILYITQTNAKLDIIFESKDDCAWEFKLRANKKEGIFGGGEQFRQLNMKGEKVTNFVSEHIVVKPIVQKTIFGFLPYRPKKHKKIETYAPMTTFTSSDKYCVRFDVDSFGVQDFTKAKTSTFRYLKLPKSMTFFKEETFEDLSKSLSLSLPNNQYLPDWCYDGIILGVQGGAETVMQKVDEAIEKGVKVCGVWCQEWSGQKITAVGKQVYWNWEVDSERYPDFKNYIDKLEAKGVRFLAYINPYLVVGSNLYKLFKKQGYLITDKKGKVYHVKSTTFDAGMIDLTHPEAVKYLKDVIIKKNMIDMGVKGYMADFAEYLPVDCVLHDGDPEQLHNCWPAMWAKINRDALIEAKKENEVMFFTRSAYNGAQSFAPIMWNGDQHTDTSIDYGMPCVMPASFNLGFSGVTLTHSDIGGYITFSSMRRGPELFIRWMEMSAFSPLMRGHETVKPQNNVQHDHPEIIEHTAYLSQLHFKLKPYLEHCISRAKLGIPAIVPDFYYSNDFSTHKDLYTYMLGEDVFVAPIIEKGATTRKVTLPKGTWVHFVTKQEYAGETEIIVDAPLGKPTAFYKKGSMFESIFKRV